MDNESMASASLDLGLYLNESVTNPPASPYDFPEDEVIESAAPGTGSQSPRLDLEGHLPPAFKARLKKYIDERVAHDVECAVAKYKDQLDALQSRLETAFKHKETVTPRRPKVDKEVSVSTYFNFEIKFT